MLYFHESTNPISVAPLSSFIADLCSSIAWNEASCVILPSLSVRRHGCVTPLLDSLLLITSAVCRNCLICSLVSWGLCSSASAMNRRVVPTKAETKILMSALRLMLMWATSGRCPDSTPAAAYVQINLYSWHSCRCLCSPTRHYVQSHATWSKIPLLLSGPRLSSASVVPSIHFGFGQRR